MLENELIRVKSTLPDQDFPDRKFAEHSAYIETGVELNARDFVGPRFSDLQDSEGQLWPFISDDNGVYHFEIATELPFYLPECYGPEQFLEVSDNRLFFCNRMVRAFFGDGYPATDGLNYILTHRAGLDQLANQVGHLYPIPIKTFVSRKFSAEDRSADSTVQNNLPDWLDQFIEEINEVLEAFRRADPINSRFIDFVRSENSFTVHDKTQMGLNKTERAYPPAVQIVNRS